MDRSTLQELSAIADNAASALGAGAAVTFQDLTPSDVQIGGSRVVLAVFRMVKGELRELFTDYRPDRDDLPALIERDTRDMARRLTRDARWPGRCNSAHP